MSDAGVPDPPLLLRVSAERFARLDALLDELVELEPEARSQRASALCEGDALLLSQLQELIAGLGDDHPLDRPAALGRELADTDPVVGGRIGAYEVIEEIGAGGMGTVYRARRADGAFERDVAIKVVRRGMDSLQLLDRFHRERSILARLEHPGITRLLDAGLLDDGRPYLTMELVEGRPWLEDCAQRSLRGRVQSVEKVARAVAYAHQQLVVHRDIKPSNVLVGEDGTAVLLDFGIARLVDHDDHTLAGQRVLTPDWAAPEQLRGEEVDVRTDVYGLGLLLHATLSGHGRVPRDDDGWCPPPSASATAKDRRKIAGDLDAITATALRPDREDRYPSAQALADDLRRHLEGSPVTARPDRWYRWLTLMRKNAASLLVSLAIVGLLIAYAVTATLQSAALERERDHAQLQAARSRTLSEFLQSLLASDYARAVEGREVTVSEVLDRARTRLDADASLSRSARAELRLLTARAYYKVGRQDDAFALAGRVLDDEALPPALRATAAELQAYARLASYSWAEASVIAGRGLVLAMASDGLSPRVAAALEALAQTLQADRRAWAGVLYGVALALRLGVDGPLHPGLAEPLTGLAEASRGGPGWLYGLALAYLGLEHPPDQAQIADTLHKYARASKGPVARALYERALELERKVYGEEHPFTLNTLNDLALFLETTDPQGSIALLEESTRTLGLLLPPAHSRRLLAMANLGAVLRDQGRVDEAEPILESALSLAETDNESMAPMLALHLGRLRERQGRPDAALVAYQRGLLGCEQAPHWQSRRLFEHLVALAPELAERPQVAACGAARQ